MDVNQIRYFLALCAEGNFTRAAKRCGIAQPSSPLRQMLRPHLELIWRQCELAYGLNAGSGRFEPFANLAYVNLHTDGSPSRAAQRR